MKPSRIPKTIRPRQAVFFGFPSSFLILHSSFFILLLTVLAPVCGRAQILPGDPQLALSYSGQFVITGSADQSPLASLPAVTTNSAFIRLEPAVLSVSAERIKQSLYRLLGLSSVQNWQGKIYLTLHPALWTDENVTVMARPIDQSWSYHVALPDVVQTDRFLRGVTGALLLELANRQPSADGHCADIPAWLIDGLSRQFLQDELAKVVLNVPDSAGAAQSNPSRHGSQDKELDPLTAARQVLRNHSPLTYDQLCWPTEAQLNGADDGVYHASAQLFVAELLKSRDGAAHLRQFLAILAQNYNWQLAFQAAFQDQFPRSLDLEKWWALTVIDFLSHEPGPAWTPAYSARLLNELLQVPVAVRMSSNSLPAHATIPLQAVVRDFKLDQQFPILEARLRDLRVAQFRLSSQFIALTDEYCQVLAAYLGERLDLAPSSRAHPGAPQTP